MSIIQNMTKSWLKVLPFCLFTLSLLFVSCKEEDDTPEEYPNWQVTNDAYFQALVADVQAKNDPLRILLPRYSWPSEKLESSLVPAYSDYIVVEKIENGPQYETESPFLTDSVAVHYVGRLLPSTSYKDGLVFDRSYVGSYDTSLASPTKFAVNRVIVGFTTALLQMHRGDHWKVYIPYQLGYKNSTSGSVPAYSTLIFDLRLEDFWTKKRGDR